MFRRRAREEKKNCCRRLVRLLYGRNLFLFRSIFEIKGELLPCCRGSIQSSLTLYIDNLLFVVKWWYSQNAREQTCINGNINILIITKIIDINNKTGNLYYNRKTSHVSLPRSEQVRSNKHRKIEIHCASNCRSKTLVNLRICLVNGDVSLLCINNRNGENSTPRI